MLRFHRGLVAVICGCLLSSFALAETPATPAAATPAPATPAAAPTVPARTAGRTGRDARGCLKLKSNAAVRGCAEKYR